MSEEVQKVNEKGACKFHPTIQLHHIKKNGDVRILLNDCPLCVNLVPPSSSSGDGEMTHKDNDNANINNEIHNKETNVSELDRKIAQKLKSRQLDEIRGRICSISGTAPQTMVLISAPICVIIFRRATCKPWMEG